MSAQGNKTLDPVVRRASRSACALAAILGGSAGAFKRGDGSVILSAANADEAAKMAEFGAMVDKLRDRMDKEPAAEGLAMLGRSYLVLGRTDDAVNAYQRALKMQPQNASLLADMAGKNVALLRADWTRRDPAVTQALAGLGRNGVPVYAIYKNGQAPVVLSEVLSVEEVRAALAPL